MSSTRETNEISSSPIVPQPKLVYSNDTNRGLVDLETSVDSKNPYRSCQIALLDRPKRYKKKIQSNSQIKITRIITDDTVYVSDLTAAFKRQQPGAHSL